jgi:hypothetical protein
LVRHLVKCGPRPVLEALIQIEAGDALDEVLENFARLQPEVYAAVGADVLPIDLPLSVDQTSFRLQPELSAGIGTTLL